MLKTARTGLSSSLTVTRISNRTRSPSSGVPMKRAAVAILVLGLTTGCQASGPEVIPADVPAAGASQEPVAVEPQEPTVDATPPTPLPELTLSAKRTKCTTSFGEGPSTALIVTIKNKSDKPLPVNPHYFEFV